MAWTVTINGTDRSSKVAARSLRIDWKLGARTTARCRMFDSSGSYRPTIGHSFLVKNGSTDVFLGSIEEFAESSEDGVRVFEVLVTGAERRLDRLIVNAVAYGRNPFTANSISDVLTFDVNPYSNGMPVQVKTTGTAPGGLSVGTTYYVRDATSTTCKLAATSGGSAINLTSDGTGNHHLIWCAGAIVSNLLSVYGIGESLTAGTIGVGSPIELATFEYGRVSDMIEQVAVASGYVWRVNADESVDFIPRNGSSAPWNVSDDVIRGSVSVRYTREEYANAVYVRYNKAAVAGTLTSFTGDGSKQIFRVATVIDSVTTITVDAAEKTVGVYGVDTGKDWYYTPGDHYIYQDSGGTVLTGSNTLYVTYKALGFDSEYAEDTVEQAARAAVEGGSGLYEAVVDQTELYSADAAEDAASAELSARKSIPVELRYQSDTDGLMPGDLQTVTLTNWGISSGSYLVDEVSAEDIDVGYLRYSVRALSTTRLGDYLTVFRSFVGGSRSSGGSSVSGGGGAGGGTGSRSDYISQTFTADTTINTTVGAAGDQLYIEIVQDGTGGWSVTWGANFEWTDGLNDIGKTAGQKTLLSFISTGSKWRPQPGGMVQS